MKINIGNAAVAQHKTTLSGIEVACKETDLKTGGIFSASAADVVKLLRTPPMTDENVEKGTAD